MRVRVAMLCSLVIASGCVSRLINDVDGSAEGGQDAGGTTDGDDDPWPEDDDDPSDSDSTRPDLPATCESGDADCDGIPDDDDPLPDDPNGPVRARIDAIYIASGSALYTFDPASAVAERIGSFTIEGTYNAEILDIAIDRFGILYAVNFEGLYVCDPGTAACTTLAYVASNSLGLVPAGILDAEDDVLVSIAGTTLTQIRLKGAAVEIIEVASVSPYSSSGDVVTMSDGTSVFTSPSSSADVIVSFDPASAALLGELGSVSATPEIWGLAAFEGALWATDSGGSIWRRDPETQAWAWIAALGDGGWGAAAHPDAVGSR